MTDVNHLPEPFLSEMKVLLGDEYSQYADSFSESWKPGLRVNTLKISPEQLKDMVSWSMEPVAWTGNGFYYGEDGGTGSGRDAQRPSRHPAYYCGLYYLQEPSAMAPAALLPVEPGDRVLDLCAAPGGKSTELGARLKGQGLLVSNDISYSRARALLKNMELAGIPNICVTSESPEKLAGVWPGFFDKILVDAPCSGEGMFRREDSMVKDWLDRGPAYYGPLQRQIACEAVKMLRPGGMMLYSTCTFSREEDEENILYLLGRFPEMELCPLDLSLVPGSVDGIGLSGCMRLFPHRLKGEGHFLALLRKKMEKDGEEEVADAGGWDSHAGGSGGWDSHAGGAGDWDSQNKVAGNRDSQPKGAGRFGEIPTEVRTMKAFKKLKGCEDFEHFMKSVSMEFDPGQLVLHQDHLYYLPKGLEWNLPLRFLRTGLLLGEMKKGRFEPSQAFAMALRAGQFEPGVCLEPEDDRVLRYLKGETIFLSPGEGPVKGWCLVSMKDYPMGWAKGTGMSLKNKYYPGWRWQ